MEERMIAIKSATVSFTEEKKDRMLFFLSDKIGDLYEIRRVVYTIYEH